MRKQPEVTERTRAALRHAFWELYRTTPIDKISIRQITERAGYNRATFYLYYHDVYDLLAQIEDKLIDDVRRVVEDRLLASGELDFSAHMGFIAELASTGTEYFATLLGEGGDPAFVRRFKEVVAPLLERFLVPAQGLTSEQRALLLEFYLSGVIGMVARWLASEDPMPVDEFIGLIERGLLHR